MPGRKSNVSTTSNGPEDGADATPAKQTKDRDGLSVEDLSLPKSMVARLAKGVLPANTQIHKDALLALHKSATVFVSYIASTSNDNAQASGKKTIAPHDVVAALKDAELETFLPRLEAELKSKSIRGSRGNRLVEFATPPLLLTRELEYNEIQCDKRNTYRRKVKEDKAAAAAKDDDAGTQGVKEGAPEANDDVDASMNGHADTGEDPERPVKKLKAENGDAVLPDAEDVDEDDAVDEGDADEDEEMVEEEIVEDEDEEEDDEDGQDETMEDALEEPEARSQHSSDDDPDSD